MPVNGRLTGVNETAVYVWYAGHVLYPRPTSGNGACALAGLSTWSLLLLDGRRLLRVVGSPLFFLLHFEMSTDEGSSGGTEARVVPPFSSEQLSLIDQLIAARVATASGPPASTDPATSNPSASAASSSGTT